MDNEDLQKPREEVTDEFVIKDDYIEVSDGHKIWYQLWGNEKAEVPFLSFHGGPGSWVKQKHKSNFKPEEHLVIFFDQRGCGRSQYSDLLKGNNTQNIINDSKQIVDKLGFSKVKAIGGSWGSALAMMFAITHPEMVEQLIIRGVYPADKLSLKHWDDGTIGLVYPEVWSKPLESTPKEFHDKPIKYHMSVIGEGGENTARSCAVMQNYEGNIMSLDDEFTFIDVGSLPADFDPTAYTIFAHFENNDYFMKDGFILENLKNYKGKTSIVHGRFDLVCPYRDAVRVNDASHDARLYPVISGHKPNHENLSVIKALL